MSTTNVRTHVFAAVAALLVVSALILETSRAAFTDTAQASGSWQAGTVTFADGQVDLSFDAGGANLAPGDSTQGCVEITYTGSLDTSSVTFSVHDVEGALADSLSVEVEMGAGEATCAAFAAVGSDTLDLVDGAIWGTGWMPAGEETRAFRLTVSLSPDAGNELQGENASATFTWTASS